MNYIERMLRDGNVRPARGTLWAMAYTDAEFERIDGIGTIKLGATLDSGLVLPSLSDEVSDSYKSVMYVVLALGSESPEQWSWEGSGVRPYVMVASRAAAGMRLLASPKTGGLRCVQHQATSSFRKRRRQTRGSRVW